MTPSSLLRGLLACVLILTAPVSALDGPQLIIRDSQDRPVKLVIENFHTEVLFIADLAQTTITVTFRNPTSRLSEGEFAIPLPPGANVSGYALDVNGTIRESTVVEKERARLTYESIKQQQVDPGFIAREKGNIYHTKIYPIPERGTKSVRLSYCEILDTKQARPVYHLTFPRIKMKSFSIELQDLANHPLTLARTGNLNFKSVAPGYYLTEIKGQIPPAKLVIHPQAPAKKIHLTADGFTYTRQAIIPPPRTSLLPQNTNALDLVWDASESRHDQDHAPAFAFLEQFFKLHPDLTVNLTHLRFTAEPVGAFTIKNGNWQALRAALEEVFYDGATNLAAVQTKEAPILLFTDGQSHFAPLEIPWSKPVNLVDFSGQAHPYWQRLARESGGQVFDLTLPDPLASSAKPLRRFDLSTKGSTTPPDQNPLIQKIIATLWAQEKLLRLEAELIPDQAKIIDHCKKHHLVSEFTSLIVLDRYADYLRYRIPPPEPDLLKRYQEDLKRRNAIAARRNPLDIIRSAREDWHPLSFPWYKSAIYPPLIRLRVWKQALTKTFQPDELNQDSLAKITAWEASLGKLALEANKLKAQEPSEAFSRKLNDLLAEANTLAERSVGRVTPDNKIAVSVNGLVNKGGKLLLAENTTLLKAIAKAGGINPLGSAARISIYRNARKTTYNTLSKIYQDVALLPGDLIVVEEEPIEETAQNEDPFTAEQPRPLNLDHTLEPAIVKNFLPPFSEYIDTSPSGGSDLDPFGGGGIEPDEWVRYFVHHDLEAPPAKTLATLKKAISEESPDLLQIYQTLRPRSRYPDSFYLELGDLFLTHKNPKLARRVLSNLIEGSTPIPAAYRKWAYLLAKHHDFTGALELIKRIAKRYPRDQVIAYDQAWLSSKTGDRDLTNRHLQRIIETCDLTRSPSRFFAELATVESRRLNAQKPLPLDLRIVLSTDSGESLHPALTEPFELFTFFNNWQISPLGGRSSEVSGISEYALRKAIPGTYQLSYRCENPQLVRIEIHRNWGRQNQTTEEQFLMLPASRTRRAFLALEIEND